MPATIDLPQTFLRMGLRLADETVKAADITPDRDLFPQDNYGMLLIWPQEFSWLKLAARTGNQAWVDGTPGTIEFERICGAMGTTSAKLAGKPGSQRLAAITGRGVPLQLHIELNTSNRKLREYARDYRQKNPNATDVKAVLKLVAFDFRKEEHTRPFEITLNISPLVPLPPFEGCVAIDLGNFSTGVASLASGNFTSTRIHCLDAEAVPPQLHTEPKTLPSLVRLDGITTWYESQDAAKGAPARVYPDTRFPYDDLAPSCQWVAGGAATDGLLARQLAGAKRLLTRADTDGTMPVPVTHTKVFTAEANAIKAEEIVQVRHRLPAELLAARMLAKFSQAVRFGNDTPAGWPRYLAVTYPTSYSPREIHALRTAIHRAWLRATHEHQATPQVAAESADGDSPQTETARHKIVASLQKRLGRQKAIGEAGVDEDPLIRLLIDEATAASFYFLFRFAAESPGGLTAFRYQYPEGMNLLLYDCGGGTTDIALVQARVTSGNSNEITMKVLGRSGVRHFGGDDITWAVCRLLKAKIAALAIKEKSDKSIPLPKIAAPDPAQPRKHYEANGKEVQKFLDAVQREGPANQYVPTEFNPTDTSSAADAPRERAMTLWTWGEQLKQKLGQPDAAGKPITSVSLGMFEGGFERGMGKLHAAILNAVFGTTAAGGNVKAFGEEVLKIQVHRGEIDAMIARPVVRTLACCRSLIGQKLPGERDEVAPVVHKVAVTGKASMYPLIRETLLERLQVSELEPEHWFHFEERELKSAVAKGAAQALAAMSGMGVNKFKFDTKMAECLPFDVAYRDFRRNEFPRLYPQQMRYAELEEKTIPFAGTEARAFTLYKRFPGDGDALDLADQTLPLFDWTEPGDAASHGYTELQTWNFSEPIAESVTVSYDAETHLFNVKDANGNEGKPITTPAEDLRARAPHQRGTL